MRTLADRIRHTVLFEIIALCLVMLMGVFFLDHSTKDIGLVSVVLTMVAMIWNFLYNFLFDKALQRYLGHTEKSSRVRIINALGFELGLLIITLPVLAWALQLTLLQAFIADIALVLFFLVYSYVFNYLYDNYFPVTMHDKSGVVGKLPQ